MTAGPSHPLQERWSRRCADDGEFRLASRYWDCRLEIDLGDGVIALAVVDGLVTGDPQAALNLPRARISAPAQTWVKVLAPVPPPLYHDPLPARAVGLRMEIDEETIWQYYPAIRRAIDLLREENNAGASSL